MKARVGFAFCLCLLTVTTTRAQMKAHIINVGQAESILLEFKAAAVLIDAGGEATGDDRDKMHLVQYLKDFFARRKDLKNTLQAVIVSHPHIDHTRLLMEVLRNFNVRAFYDGGDQTGSGIAQLKDARKFVSIRKIGYQAIRDDKLTNKGLSPPKLSASLKSSDADIRFLTGSRDCENGNNNSLIVRVQYLKTSFLLTGDAELEGDAACGDGQLPHLLNRFENTNLLDIDVYKVGHHGSFNATDEEVLEALTPNLAVISAGNESTREPSSFHAYFFGHPRENVVAMLEQHIKRTRPAITAITFNKGFMPRSGKKPNDETRIVRNRRVDKAVYCTCWDKDIVISVNAAGDHFSVTTGQ